MVAVPLGRPLQPFQACARESIRALLLVKVVLSLARQCVSLPARLTGKAYIHTGE